jgi:hypothetical protein
VEEMAIEVNKARAKLDVAEGDIRQMAALNKVRLSPFLSAFKCAKIFVGRLCVLR